MSGRCSRGRCWFHPTQDKEYGEARQIGFGFVRGRLLVVVFTESEPRAIRIISARKANRREKVYFEETFADQLGKN